MSVTINGDGTITGLSVGGLPDGIVDTDVLANNAVTSAKTTVAGVTMVDHWRMNSNTTAGEEATITAWSQVSTAYSAPGRMGSSMSVSSGIWTFPQTGIYNITATFNIYIGAANDSLAQVRMYVTDNGGSNYQNTALWRTGSLEDAIHHSITNNYVMDVDNTSNVKFYFDTGSFSSNSYVSGQSDYGTSSVTVIRLGDT